jgi:hypothetical protein
VGIGILVGIFSGGKVGVAAGAELAVPVGCGTALGVWVTALAEVRMGESREQAEPIINTTTSNM